MKETKTIKQYEGWMGEALHILGGALPPVDEGLDDTRSFADLPHFADEAAKMIADYKATLRTLREILQPSAGESFVGAAERLAKAAREVPDTLTTLDEELNRARKTIAEQEKIIAEQAEQRETRERFSQTQPVWADTASATVNNALLEWAREKMESGKLAVRVKVIDLEEAA